MAILKTIIGHSRSSKDLQDYLEQPTETLRKYLVNGGAEQGLEQRALMVECSENVRDPENWAQEFDVTRRAYRKNTGRTFYHFVISPDPKEAPSLEQVSEIAYSWAQEHFGIDGQFAIVYHNDNAKNIIHAHVVLNAVKVDATGSKWHFGTDDYAELANSVHAKTREVGIRCDLRDVGFAKQDEVSRRRTYSTAELKMYKSNKRSWKNDICEAINACAPRCSTWDEFKEMMMDSYGVGVKDRERGGFTFVHPWNNGTNHKYTCKDYKLGSAYTASAIETLLTYDAMPLYIQNITKGNPEAAKAFEFRKRENAYKLGLIRKRELTLPKDYVDKIYRKSRRVGLDLNKKLADALRTMREFNPEGNGTFESIHTALKAEHDTHVAAYEDAYANSRAAYEVMVKLREFEEAKPIYDEYVAKGKLFKHQFFKKNEEAIVQYEAALEWLMSHNLDPKGASSVTHEDARSRWKELKDIEQAAYDKAAKSLANVEKLEDAITTLKEKLAPVRLRNNDRARVHVPAPSASLEANSMIRNGSYMHYGARKTKNRHKEMSFDMDKYRATKRLMPFGPIAHEDYEKIAAARKRDIKQQIMNHELSITKKLAERDKLIWETVGLGGESLVIPGNKPRIHPRIEREMAKSPAERAELARKQAARKNEELSHVKPISYIGMRKR